MTPGEAIGVFLLLAGATVLLPELFAPRPSITVVLIGLALAICGACAICASNEPRPELENDGHG